MEKRTNGFIKKINFYENVENIVSFFKNTKTLAV